ncbi:HNH endonuclease [Natrinema sp. DC36]|uniref:HNH endonuclease n=1 Tax=Natrinema sp. DC36 TaxID=2878680 RepID=UPI001CF0776C|nr:HNH endonuclease [Natrinema sp. DC36]
MGCFICERENPAVLEEHHIVPKRHGGSDADENLVTLCASCHSAVEKLYNKRFYVELGVEKGKSNRFDRAMEQIALEGLRCMSRTKKRYEYEFGDFPRHFKYPDLSEGEKAGYYLGYLDACGDVAKSVTEQYDCRGLSAPSLSQIDRELPDFPDDLEGRTRR